jgi:hypothetical protein
VVPPNFANFFVASAGAGAALAGLLFLAITVGTVKSVGSGAPVERRSVSSSAFLGLINAFFISMAGLIPDTNLGITAFLAGLASAVLMAFVGRELALGQPWRAAARRVALIALSVVLYLLECWRGVQLLGNPSDAAPVTALASVLLIVYAVAILRVWELVGAERRGVLGQLSPLRDLDERLATASNG